MAKVTDLQVTKHNDAGYRLFIKRTDEGITATI